MLKAILHAYSVQIWCTLVESLDSYPVNEPTSKKGLNDLEDEGQGQPFSIGVERSNRCIFDINLVDLGGNYGELSH